MKSKFTEGFGKYVCDGDTIETVVRGITFVATVQRDDDMGPPWSEHDGHGVVSDWTRRDKQPGERVLTEDRGGCKRYYDVQASQAIALKDGWDAPPYKAGSKRQQAARAVARDYEVLRLWCKDEWWWCSIIISASVGGIELDTCLASLGGIEANYPDSDNAYLLEVANELLDEAIPAALARVSEIRDMLKDVE